MPRLARKSPRTPWLQLLLVVVLLGRALVPVGYMPGPGGLMLCPAYGGGHPGTGAGAAMAAHDMAAHDMAGMDMSAMHAADGDPAGPGSTAHEGSCAFAAAATPLAGVHSFPPVAYSAYVPQDFLPRTERPIPRGTIVPTRLPRGPPLLST